MLAVFFRQTKTTPVTNLAKSGYRKMIAITSFTLAEPPNGLELSCLAEAGRSSLLYVLRTAETRCAWGAARRVSFSELLGGVAGLRPPVLGQQLPRVACARYPPGLRRIGH